MAFEIIIIDPAQKAALTADGHKWRRHNVRHFGIAMTANISIAGLEAEAQRLGKEAPNGLWDRAVMLKDLGEKALAATIESDEALVRNVPVSKPEKN